MEFGAAATATATTTVTKKHSSSYGVTGRSAYDGVFATPIKLRAPSFSSQFDDYREIFGASSGSSIPILELPEINEKRTVDDARRSKVDYSMVFGGFENLDTAVPFEELVAKPKERSSFNNGASARKKVKSGEQSRREDRNNCSKEIPVVPRVSNDAKRISMSYHKVNQGSENGTNGTTHIAQLHAVPAYTCLVEEVNSSKKNRVEKTIPVAQDTYSASHFIEGIKEGGRRTESVSDPSLDNAKKQSSNNGVKEGGRRTKSFADPSPDNAKKQSSNNGVKAKKRSDSVDLFYEISNESNGSHQVKEGRHRSKSFTDPSPDSATKQSSNNGVKTTNRSDSIDMFYDAHEISNGSNGTHQTEIPQLETVAGNLGNHNVDSLRSIATKCQASRSGTHEGAAGADSPTYVDDMVDSNSAAAASVAALRKAIEDAQVRMKVAKESMRRKKEGFPDRVKQKSNIELNAGEKEAKRAYKTTKPEKITTRHAFRGTGDLPQISSEVGKPMMRKELVRPDLGGKEMCFAEEPVQEAQKKLNSSQAEHKEEVELKAEHKGKYLELKEATNTEKVSYNRNTCWSASAEPEESDHTIEIVKEYCEPENDDEKVHADNTSGACEELVNETKDSLSHGIVDETKLIQETLNNGTNDMVLKVNENGEEESKVTPFNEPKDYESNLGGQGLKTGNKEKLGCKPEEDGLKVDGSIELEERQKSLKAFQELGKGEKNIPQEQKESQDKVELLSELEECELTEFLDPIDNEGACNPHHPDLTSMGKEVDQLGYLEDQERRNESGFLDANQEIEHSRWREATDNTFSNIYVQEILADIVDHIHDDEGIYESNTKDNELDGNGRVQDAWASEIELEGTTQPMKGNESERKDNKVIEAIIESETDPNYEEIQAKEFGNTVDPSCSYEPDETEKLSETQVADTVIENDETQVTLDVCSRDAQDDIMVASTASIQHEDKYEEPEYAQETNGFCEYGETSAFECGASELNETVNQMKHTLEAVEATTNIGETKMKVRNQCLENAESDCDPAMLVEETIAESAEICKDAKEARIASDEETDENRSNSSSEEDILFDNEHNTGASQVPSMSELKSSLCKEEEVKPTLGNSIGTGKPPKVELDKEHLKTINEAKQRKREREREKLAVERAIREARERAFADAKERAALEKAASEARQKNISDGRERLAKATSQANEKTPAERAALEAKLKAERAAVERATSEARARALSRALSEKAASDARNKSDKSIGEKNTGASRDNRMKHNFQSKSFSYSEVHEFDGANGDSAQRCKARSERHQRIGERVAKALEEKNMRDWLAQKEQEEKNKVAEARDADVKRWSSGKKGNLRALLSTLQYILGPDSGWQPIPLTEIVTTAAVKKAYRKATLCVHPDKLQQRGASVQQKYICEKVFDLLKEAWNRFNVEER